MRKRTVEYTDYDYLENNEAVYQGFDQESDTEVTVVEAGQAEPDWSDEEAGQDWGEINSRNYKDPRRYIRMLYRKDVSRYPQPDPDKQTALAHIVRRGMICDCSVMPEDPKVPEDYPYKLVDKTSKVRKRLHVTDEENEWVESLGDEEKKKIIAEGRTAQDKMIAHNLPLVMSVATAEPNLMEYLDRVQAGNEGLMKAVQYFNPDLGCQFSTFATKLIRNEIRDHAKEERKRRPGSQAEECYVATDADIEKIYERMGGRLWMREVEVDTDQFAERIRKQIAVLLEEKKHIESVANYAVLGSVDDYDSVLSRAERLAAEEQTAEEQAVEMQPAEVLPQRSRVALDLIRGDGEPPKKKEMSTEDYVRRFFGMVYELKNTPEDGMARYVLEDKQLFPKKAAVLRRNMGIRYTEEDAIKELPSLIEKGNLWPEQHLGLPISAPEYFDTGHPTESIALILLDGYVLLRQKEIREDAANMREYYEWLCGIIALTKKERLDELNGAMMEDLASGATYRQLQAKYQICSDKVNQCKTEILQSLYDQIVESSNRENGDALIQHLKLDYQAWTIARWKNAMISKMVNDNYLAKKPFSLRSRGNEDAPRPAMEPFYRGITDIRESVASAAPIVREICKTFNIQMQKLFDFFSSEGYERIMSAADAEMQTITDEEPEEILAAEEPTAKAV